MSLVEAVSTPCAAVHSEWSRWRSRTGPQPLHHNHTAGKTFHTCIMQTWASRLRVRWCSWLSHLSHILVRTGGRRFEPGSNHFAICSRLWRAAGDQGNQAVAASASGHGDCANESARSSAPFTSPLLLSPPPFLLAMASLDKNDASNPLDEDAPAQPISVPDSGDTGESGKLKMIVQLVKKCLGVKDIAAMYVHLLTRLYSSLRQSTIQAVVSPCIAT